MGKISCFYPDKQGRQCPGFRERKPSRTAAPPFFKALRKGRLFCWVAFPSLVGVLCLFLSVWVIECFCGIVNKARFRALFSNGEIERIHFTGFTLFPAPQNCFPFQPNSSVLLNSYCAGCDTPKYPPQYAGINNISSNT